MAAVILILAINCWYVDAVERAYGPARERVRAASERLSTSGRIDDIDPALLPELVHRQSIAEQDFLRLDNRLHQPVVSSLARDAPRARPCYVAAEKSTWSVP